MRGSRGALIQILKPLAEAQDGEIVVKLLHGIEDPARRRSVGRSIKIGLALSNSGGAFPGGVR